MLHKFSITNFTARLICLVVELKKGLIFKKRSSSIRKPQKKVENKKMAIETNFISTEHMIGHGRIIRPKGLVVLHGAAGSGKGTAGEAVAERMSANGVRTIHFASGDALRQKYDAQSSDFKERRIAEIAQLAQKFMKRGELVPVEPMTELIALRLHQINENENADEIIMDGFPRSRPQELALRRLLGDEYFRRDVLIDAVLSTARGRAEGRGRADDNKDAIDRRMNLFYVDESENGGILQMVYGNTMDIRDGKLKSIYKRIDAEQDPKAVQDELYNFIMQSSPLAGMRIATRRHRVHGLYDTNGNGVH
jgi:adenylate kinase